MDDTAEEGARLERLLVEKLHALGEEHPETLSTMLDLADCLWGQGRLIAAGKLEQQVVATRRRILGGQHFDTLKATGKLAVTMAAQGSDRSAGATGARRRGDAPALRQQRSRNTSSDQ